MSDFECIRLLIDIIPEEIIQHIIFSYLLLMNMCISKSKKTCTDSHKLIESHMINLNITLLYTTTLRLPLHQAFSLIYLVQSPSLLSSMILASNP